MKKSFTLGAIAGMTSLALAVPLVVQLSSAASSSSASASADVTKMMMRHQADTSVAGIQAMIDHDTAFLANVDAMIAVHKSATTAHKAALTAALSITDDAQRQAAVQKAHEDMRTAMQAFITAHPDLQMKMMFGKGPGGHGRGHGLHMTKLADKLGMTEAEFKAAIESGKTIEQIATEKGITLPARPAFGKMGRGMMDNDGDDDSTQQ